MQEPNVPYIYLSASAYAKQTGIGEAEVKKQLIKGELEGFKTNNQYKIKVYKDGSVSFKQYESLLKENIELKTKMKDIATILS